MIWPAFQERAFEAYRAYYEFVPKGKFATEYTILLNQSGRFELNDSTATAVLLTAALIGAVVLARRQE